MASRKRWTEVYTEGNPLAMPQTIRRHLKSCACGQEDGRIRYLWAVLGAAGTEEMGEEHWLNVVDEAASLGADTLVISICTAPSERSELAAMCKWAAGTHGMRVGVHLSDAAISAEDAAILRSLSSEKFCVFVNSRRRAEAAAALGDGVTLVDADGLEDGAVQPHCELPRQMACVSDAGEMYTCGLVVGQDGFFLGNANDAPIKRVHCDDALPHHVPEGTSDAPHRCEGCPPLLEERLRRAFGG